MTPKTSDVIESLGSRGVKNVVVVPVAFTSDHVETLYEIGIEYAEEAEEAGITNFKCTEGLNGSPIFIEALADIVDNHLTEKQNYSAQYKMKCLKCTKPLCRQIMNPMFGAA
jgi:ferrochelatase